MITLSQLPLPAAEYSHLTFPKFRPFLQGEGAGVAIGAHNGGEAVGLSLGAIDLRRRTGNVLSIAVAADYRGQGLGTALLRDLERELSRDCTIAEAVFTEATAAFPYVKRMFEGQGWGPAAPHMLLCHTTLELMLKPAWMHKSYLPPEFAIFPWCELSEAEKTAIREQRDFTYPPVLSPFNDERPIEPLTSLGLRYRGEVVGWFITYMATPDTLGIGSMYVRPEFSRRGRAVSLLIESMARCRAPKGVFGIHVGNRPMIEFAKRRLGPCITAMYFSYQALKNLSRSTAASEEA